MIKYKVVVGTISTEFAAVEDATAFALANSASVEEVSYDLPAANILDVTPRQIRQALILSGVSLTDIDTALDSLPEPTKSLAKVEWEFSIAFQRNRPLVAQVAQMLGWTDAQLDALWLMAAGL